MVSKLLARTARSDAACISHCLRRPSFPGPQRCSHRYAEEVLLLSKERAWRGLFTLADADWSSIGCRLSCASRGV